MDGGRRGGSGQAFTLIELLIVVAIIAILAAIAVPNFLEAQTRAKISRVHNDLRTIATGMEAYRSDWNTYPGDSHDVLGAGGCQGGLAYLTTPVAYLAQLARDPFHSHAPTNARGAATFYEMGSGADNAGWGNAPWRFGPECLRVPRQHFLATEPIQSFIVYSTGPDLVDSTTRNDEWPGYGQRGTNNMVILRRYDPTNGTISPGDIYRAGGILRIGNYEVDGEWLGNI